MKITYFTLAAAAGLAIAGAAAAAENLHGGRPLHATLSGSGETPPGDPKGTGTATIRVNEGQGQVCWDISVKDLTQAMAAHIHKGTAGLSGPPVVALTPPDASGKSTGCASADAELAKDLIQNPGSYYVNVHTAQFKGGAIRGQLEK